MSTLTLSARRLRLSDLARLASVPWLAPWTADEAGAQVADERVRLVSIDSSGSWTDRLASPKFSPRRGPLGRSHPAAGDALRIGSSDVWSASRLDIQWSPEM